MGDRERIRALREDRDLTQRQIAALLHVSQKTYSDCELGKTRIHVDSLIALARFYDVDMNCISGLPRQKTPYPGETRER